MKTEVTLNCLIRQHSSFEAVSDTHTNTHTHTPKHMMMPQPPPPGNFLNRLSTRQNPAKTRLQVHSSLKFEKMYTFYCCRKIFSNFQNTMKIYKQHVKIIHYDIINEKKVSQGIEINQIYWNQVEEFKKDGNYTYIVYLDISAWCSKNGKQFAYMIFCNIQQHASWPKTSSEE